jgi:hypothetical protein
MIFRSKHQLGCEVVVIEATLIHNGAVDDDCRKTLFKLDPINGWLQTSKAKPIVNLIPIDMFSRDKQQDPQQLSHRPS